MSSLTVAHVIVAVVLCSTVLMGVSIAQGGGETYSDDFEDGDIDGWEGPAASISQTSIDGQYSLEQQDGYDPDGGDPVPVQWNSGPTLDLSQEFTIQGTSYSSQGEGDYQTRVGLINDNDEGAMLAFSGATDSTILTDFGAAPGTSPSIPGDYDETWVRWEIYSAGDGTIEAKVWETGEIEPEAYQMSRSFDAVNSRVGLNAGNQEDGDRYILLDSVSVEGTEATDPNLDLDAPTLVRHGESKSYSVDYTTPDNRTIDVTSAATVESLNEDALTVNESDNSLVATENTEFNDRVEVRAEYNGSVTYAEVAVAEVTLENADILPTMFRFTALINDGDFFFILLATMAGVVGTRWSTSFGGLGFFEIVIVIGWFGGWVQGGLMLVSVFFAGFIGLNLSANIDYTVRR